MCKAAVWKGTSGKIYARNIRFIKSIIMLVVLLCFLTIVMLKIWVNIHVV